MEKHNRNKLDKSRPTFLLVGLCIVLMGVYGLFNLKTYASKPPSFKQPKEVLEDEFQIPRTQQKKEQLKKQKQKTEKLKKNTFSNVFKIDDSDLNTLKSFEDTALAEIIDWQQDDVDMEIDINILDKKPIFPGCENILNEKERFECFQQNMIGFVASNFKPCQGAFGVTKEKMYVKFTINKNGQAVNAEIFRGSDECNRERALKIINNLPLMKPGMYRDKRVNTSFVLPINIK